MASTKSFDSWSVEVQHHIRQIIRLIGDDPEREELIDTPGRIAKMYNEIFCGYSQTAKPNITIFKNGSDGIYYNDMIIDQGYFFSFCEHHMLPFFGEYFFSYIPDKYIIGASKIGRTVDYFSSRLQVAERLVHQIVDFLEDKLKPKGLALTMSGRHLCKEMRGLKKINSPFEVIAVRGVFSDPSLSTKEEFLSRIQNRR